MAISSAVMASQASLFRPTPNFTPKFPHTPNPILHFKPKLYSLPKLTCLALRPISSSEPEPEPEPTLTLSSSAPTRTLTTLFALALRTISSLPVLRLAPLALSSAKPLLFFAATSSSGPLNTPLTVVAAGLSKWLDIYSAVLLVRVLLSWFPNIPWDQQPLSAIRDLCDPYLNLFRNIIPPVFNTLDISPLMAFAVLGTLGSILNNSAKGV